MASSEMTEQRLADYPVSAGVMITPKSYLVDRIVPDCAVIALPPKVVSGGVLRFGTTDTPKMRTKSKGYKRLLRGKPDDVDSDGRVIFEFRSRSPQNWAHFLNNHLPLYFYICTQMGLDWDDTVLVTPSNTPGYIREAAAVFGLSLIASDGNLIGPRVDFTADPWSAVRTSRRHWVQAPRVIDAVGAAVAESGQIPERVFLARRKTRALSNMDEIEAFLKERGFSTIYPEDLSAADQFSIFHKAHTVVAIHGASLAPLLYRPTDHGVRQLLEIMPCGHVTDVYRVMAQQVGCRWISVQGRMKPEYVDPSYDFAAPFKSFSVDSFSADPLTLASAFEMLQESEGTAHA